VPATAPETVPPPPDVLAARHLRLRALLPGLGIERLLVTTLPNVAWLTGFEGSAAAALVGPEAVVLITDRRYRDEAAAMAAHAGGSLRVELVSETYDETLAALIAREPGPAGFEAAGLTVARHRWLSAALRAASWSPEDLTATSGAVEACRVVKDAWEVALLKEAGARLSAVARGVLADLRPGIRERDVAQGVEAGLRRAGFSRPAFDTIVASGPRAALPHGRATDRTVERDELVVLDFGGVYGGYCVDLTRTVALGDPGPDAREWHAAVLSAQEAAIRAAVPGRALHEVDRAARERLEARGLGGLFPHGTGHGLGLEVHEAPRIGPFRPEVAGSDSAGDVPLPDQLVPGMVFTVEPGVYVPGRGGVRIEDDVLVTASGSELLTSVPRALGL
jgi:Xaa-Pro aminopeptidase